MKKINVVAGTLTCLYMVTARAEPTIDSNKSAVYVGTQAMVCGKVFEVTPFSKGTYINVGARFPNQHISFLVWNTDQPKFNARFGGLGVFLGAQACARGVIEPYKSRLQIKVSNPQFLRLIK